MPIDWDVFEDDLDVAINESAQKTDAHLATKISSITRMTDEEVTELFPNPADTKTLAKLMRIVKDTDDRNKKTANIVANSEEFAGIILTLLSKFA